MTTRESIPPHIMQQVRRILSDLTTRLQAMRKPSADASHSPTTDTGPSDTPTKRPQ
jgi:hypothetical protein